MYWWDHGNINAGWWTANGITIANVASVAAQPTYLVEEYAVVTSGESLAQGSGEIPVPRIFHRITASGVGLNATTRVSVQATFVQAYNN